MAITTRQRGIALLRGRCPRCLHGRIFSDSWRMNPQCPECGLTLERGPGYFTGAMYFSYFLGVPIIALLTLLVFLIRPRWHLWQDVLLAWGVFLPLVPFVFRASRILWIHFDQYFDPD